MNARKAEGALAAMDRTANYFGITDDFSGEHCAELREARAAVANMAAVMQRAAHVLAELHEQPKVLLALRTQIVEAIKQVTPEYYGGAA